jgi:hypothetical protein
MTQLGWLVILICCVFVGIDVWLMKIADKLDEVVALLERDDQRSPTK